ncbi:MAG: PspA/IM30 family protein [Planctomycetaceae bacterium]|nr:PspA/IM30 family protein [Planctomycetaceae bacterium]
MSYFSRLTDIVTCNLSSILAEAEDPSAALEEIIKEMQVGVESAQRSVKTAAANEVRIAEELEDLSNQSKYWQDMARQHVQEQREDKARLALMRRSEVNDLIAGIKQQHASAQSTLSHLTTTLHALEARLADATRRRTSVSRGNDAEESVTGSTGSLHAGAFDASDDERDQQIEDELAALKRELGS